MYVVSSALHSLRLITVVSRMLYVSKAKPFDILNSYILVTTHFRLGAGVDQRRPVVT